MSRTLTGWSFWGTRGSRGTEAPARQPGTRVNPLQRAGPIRVRAEIPSVTRKRAFLNHAEVQDVPGDLQTGGWGDPCGAGAEPDRWVAYFSTDPDLSVASILETVADRSALEQVFHDVKEVHGAGQQQLRHVWANVGAWNLIGWWHTLVELWAWDRPQSRLRDRSDSPWDKPERRPSHANRCQELRREALQEEYSSLPSVGGLHQKSAGSFSTSCAESHEADSSGKVQNGVKTAITPSGFIP